MKDDFDKAVNMVGGICEYAQEREVLGRLWRSSLANCGACQHWMKKRECPAEKAGRIVSCSAIPCPSFTPERSYLDSVDRYDLAKREFDKRWNP